MPENAIYKRDMGVVMDREFGDKCGIWRILDLFERENIKATFFLNGITAEQNVDAVKEMVANGHELAAQPYIHEYTVTLDKDGERKIIQGSIDAFAKVAGVTPRGYLSPGVRPTPNTIDLISDMGFTWSSDCIDEDVPYSVGPKEKPIVMMPKDFHPERLHHLRDRFAQPARALRPAGRSVRLSLRRRRDQPEGHERHHASIPGRPRVSRQDLPRFHAARARASERLVRARRRHRGLVAQAKYLSARANSQSS